MVSSNLVITEIKPSLSLQNPVYEVAMVSRCALCGEEAKGRMNEHLLSECTSASVVKLRKEVEAAVEKKVSRLVKLAPVREAIMVPCMEAGQDW